MEAGQMAGQRDRSMLMKSLCGGSAGEMRLQLTAGMPACGHRMKLLLQAWPAGFIKWLRDVVYRRAGWVKLDNRPVSSTP